jgi:hypothetical protein
MGARPLAYMARPVFRYMAAIPYAVRLKSHSA